MCARKLVWMTQTYDYCFLERVIKFGLSPHKVGRQQSSAFGLESLIGDFFVSHNYLALGLASLVGNKARPLTS